MSKVNIREMSGEDVEGILDIERKVSGKQRAATYTPVPDSCIGGEVENSIVAEADDQIIGFLLGRIARSPIQLRDIAWIELIGILPEYHKQGIGKQLIDVWVENCRIKGISKVHVMLNSRDQIMQPFFKSAGFSQGNLINFELEV